MIILGTNSIKDTGYDVANSCRFDDGSSDYLHKTPSGAGTSADLFTFSMWIKRGIISSSDRIVLFYAQSDAQNFDRISFTDADVLEWKGVRSDSQAFNLTTSQVFRDISSWYHLHFIWDSADSTADNRMRIYVNGTQVTAFGTRANPSSGLDAIIGSAQKHSVGSTGSSGTYYDGYMAEVVYLDSQELTPDGNTGEFDEDSGIWKPIDVSGLTFGTNGFYLDFEDSANLGNDANGGTDLTEVNLTAIDQSTDTCTNNFATWNPLRTQAGFSKTMADGNLSFTNSANDNASIPSTMAASSGKWYAEFKCTTSASNWGFGIAQVNQTILSGGSHGGYPDTQGGVAYLKDGRLVWYAGGDASSDTGTTYTTNDIIGILMDLDNTRVYWYKNDTLVNSGGFNYSVVNSGSTLENNYYFMAGSSDGGTDPVLLANFGSPPHAITSGNTDPNGYGNFEFATKGGYALNTKNLAEFG